MVQRLCSPSAPLPRVNCELFGGKAAGEAGAAVVSHVSVAATPFPQVSCEVFGEEAGGEAGAAVVWQAIVGAIPQCSSPIRQLAGELWGWSWCCGHCGGNGCASAHRLEVFRGGSGLMRAGMVVWLYILAIDNALPDAPCATRV